MDSSSFENSTRGSALRFEDEACRILRTSMSAKEVLLICSYFPFGNIDTPSRILYSRKPGIHLTDINELELRLAREILSGKITECDPCTRNMQWSTPIVSTTMRVVNDTDEDMFKVTFMALVRKACFHESRAVTSHAMASILNPIKELFENQALSLMSTLRRLPVLHVLHEDILDGRDLEWVGLREEDFSLLEDLTNHTPQQLARLLTDKDVSCSQKFSPGDFVDPSELRCRSLEWSSLIYKVRVCAKAHSDLVGGITEAAKILLNHENFFSGMALIYGLKEANHHPPEFWWKYFTVEKVCMAYQLKNWLRIYPRCIGNDARSKSVQAGRTSGRYCIGGSPTILSIATATFSFMGQYMTSRPQNSSRSPEQDLSRRQISLVSEGLSTAVGDREGYKEEILVPGRSEEVENMCDMATKSGIPGQIVSTPSTDDYSHTEITTGLDADHDETSESDSAIGLNNRDSTTTLSSELFNPIENYGREYHNFQGGTYLLPNDERERERLDL